MNYQEEKILLCKAISCVCLLILMTQSVIVYQLVSGASEERGGVIWEIYDFYAESYQSNPLILNVSNFCSQFENRVECVYYTVPYEYHESIHFFVTPEEFWSVGGVCKDRSIMLKSVMNNLDISCGYIFSPIHVYLTCSENGKIYKLNHRLEVYEP